MQNLKSKIEELLKSFENLKDSLKFEEKKLKLKELGVASNNPDLWENSDKAKRLMQEVGSLKKEIEEIEEIEESLTVLKGLVDENSLSSGFLEDITKVEKQIQKLKLTSFLSGRYDHKNALFSIHAGQGGVEAMDWASMLYRMYLRYFELKGWNVETIDLSEGEEAGLKSVTLKVSGQYAYGYIRGEAGTHRLVRQSPFNVDKLRQTSFALVEVLPELEEVDLPNIKIRDEDLEWQFFRSSTQGGQNVQKVSTAVRLKHKPTGIVVTAQSQRFQEQNRKIALSLLRAKLWSREKFINQEKVKEIKGEYRAASWGNQIRSYVLHPYKMVKDLRTGVETSNTEAVLDGNIDQFIEAELKFAK